MKYFRDLFDAPDSSENPPILSIEYDSRQCRKGSLFVAAEGTDTDGHAFIGKAIENGATVIVCEKAPDISRDVLTVLVPDSRKELARLSHAFYDFPAKNLRIIGVTGTNGKTTTTFILRQIFAENGEKTGIIGTTGNYIGDEFFPTNFTTPEAPELCALLDRMKKSGVTTVIMEVSSHALAQSRAEGIAFSGAIFTNLTQDHLDFHGSMEEYARTKKMLFDGLSSSAVALVNGDDPFGKLMIADCKADVRYTVGRSKNAEILIENEEFGFSSTQFSLRYSGEILAVKTALVGRFNVENAAFSAVCALALGVPHTVVLSALKTATAAPGRMQKIPLKTGGIAVIDYAHTPDALEKALAACMELQKNWDKSGGNLVCVFGCGGNRDRTKRPIMGRISAEWASCTVLTDDNPRQENPDKIIAEILEGISIEKHVSVKKISDRREAIRFALERIGKHDIVLIAGKGHETYQIIGNERFHFDDAEEVLAWLLEQD